MRNPFRTEAEAFRFVWLTIIYFALIVDRLGDQHVARRSASSSARRRSSSGGSSRAAATSSRFRRRRRRIADGEHRILVIANETVGGERAARRRSSTAPRACARRCFVVCPALNSPLKHWVSDEDEARVAAQTRLEASLAAMHDAGIEARGEIGDSDPLPAIEDAHPHVRARRADHLDAPRGPLELARARHRRLDARAVRAAGDARGRRSRGRAPGRRAG